MSHLLIKNIQIIDPNSQFHQTIVDVECKDGVIIQIGKNLDDTSKKIKVIDGTHHFLSHSWVDMFGDVFTPGFEYRETFEHGVKAALNGGFGHVVMSPNHHPEVYLAAHIQQMIQSTAHETLKIHVTGAITKKIEGKELAEMYDMYNSGAVAFTDGWSPVQNELVLLQALEYVRSFDGLIYQIPIHKNLNSGGLMNESPQSTAFGISSQPSITEDIHVYTALTIAQYQNARIHISGVSTAKALDTIKKFKKQNVQVTCSVTPYHILYNDSYLETYNSIYKVNPPLRTEIDRKAIIKGLEDGTIDGIASFNQPYSWDEKVKEFEYAKSGMATLQYVWPMLLKGAPQIPVETWIKLLSFNPRQILKIDSTPIEVGYKGTLTMFNTEEPINIQEKASLAFNTPELDQTFKGKAQVI